MNATSVPVTVETVASNLSFPWDVTFLPDRSMLVTERGGRLLIKPWGAPIRTLSANLSDLYSFRELGLLGIVVDPAFSTNRRFYTCQVYKGTGSTPIDARVIRWRLSDDASSAWRQGSPVVTGIPVNPVAQMHVGCRLRFDRDGKLRISTGDAATGTVPQDLHSLGGKTLRVNADGTVPADNPFVSLGGRARYVWTYGHRNVQGLALRPGYAQLWSAEHGPDRDDEVNLLVRGGNYGWDPVPDYNQSVPMTDLSKFPDAVIARWSSGYPTIAPSGLGFLVGERWGAWRGGLAMATLKDTGVEVLMLDGPGTVLSRQSVPELDGTYGRLRTVQLGPGNALYVTTSNGSNDKVLRVTPTTG